MDLGIFRAYSIRGVTGESLTTADMGLIGQAIGTILHDQALTGAVVGWDYRLSSTEMAGALIDGLLSTGMDVIDIGPCPTPMLNFATDHYGAGAGLMVTASHNPPPYNGLKIRTDHSLRGGEIKEIYRVAQAGTFRVGRGRQTQANPAPAYLDALNARAAIKRPLRVVVDAGNGAAGPLVLPLIRTLGCTAIPLYCEPDGRFPNHTPDPTAPGALDALAARVAQERADAGLAYDGDGDRLAMVDETGRTVFGDYLLALLARETLVGHPGGKVVYELSCTQALAETVESLGGQAIPSPVGYAFVHETMKSVGAVLGGETAGHLFFADPDFRFDDAILATTKMLSLLSTSTRPFSVLLAELPQYTLSPEYRFFCPDHHKEGVVETIRQQFAAKNAPIEDIDGVKVYPDGGWGLFRASNTQPAVTLRCEARTPARLAEIEEMMLQAVREALEQAGLQMVDAH